MMLSNEIKLYRKRIEHFRNRLETYILSESVPLKAEYALAEDRLSFEKRLILKYKPIHEGELWGKSWQSAWFHLQGTVPENWQGKEVVAQLNFSGEALIFSHNGLPLQGLSNASIFDPTFKRDLFPLFKICEGNELVELWVEAVASDLFGMFIEMDPVPGSPDYYGHYEAKIERLRLAVFDRRIWHLLLDFDILLGLLKHLPENSVRFARILRALNLAIVRFADNPQNAVQSREALRPVLSKPAHASELTVYAVGHAHIDTAWLWPVTETIRKCARTFANQISLLKEYPQFVFGASQPQHYLFIKKYYPLLYEEIREYVKQGRWELQGGMWVEADCNLISGESMVRQILHGKNFFMEEFGIEVKNLWLPDVFGYSAALPQILLKSGIDYFLTQKLSWNPINDFPYTTFLWQGIDGSKVLAHFPPENVYQSKLNADSLITGRDNFREKDFINEFISLFGIGDGGGGPKAEYIEYGKRMANLEGAPKVKFAPAFKLFERLEQYRAQLPVWNGELFLEMHLGTLTSQARVKKNNRLLELELRTTEMLWSCLPPEYYPQEMLDAVWKKALINQFHDIIPGSSIHKVYETTIAEYSEALKKCERLQQQAAERLFESDDNHLVLINSLPFAYDEVIALPAGIKAVVDEKGQRVEVQQTSDETLALVHLPALSAISLQKVERNELNNTTEPAPDELILENEMIRYEFDSNGQLIFAFDKQIQHSVLNEDQKGNVLQLFQDHPADWDAWEVDYFYDQQLLEEARSVSYQRVENGPLRHGLLFEFRIGNSQIKQKIYLNKNSKCLNFDTWVYWKEKHRMLRVYFEANIHASQATFDIQFGYLQRPIHRNTSWDRARYEVPAHKYADLSQPDYGVALLNNCKYGYKVYNGGLSLNLLRSPTYPDPDCDHGEHTFIYSFLPHQENLLHSDVIKEGWKLNQKPLIFSKMKTKGALFPFSILGEGVRLEAVKKAEKEDCLVLRLVEEFGRRTKITLRFNQRPAKITESDLIEWRNIKELPANPEVELEFNSFEIRTFKIYWSEQR